MFTATTGTRGLFSILTAAGVLCLAATTAGCSRDASSPGESNIDYRKALEQGRQRRTAAANLVVVTEALRRFHVDLGRLPNDLNELVRLGYLRQIPPAPPGAAYGYDRVHGNVTYVQAQQQPVNP